MKLKEPTKEEYKEAIDALEKACKEGTEMQRRAYHILVDEYKGDIDEFVKDSKEIYRLAKVLKDESKRIPDFYKEVVDLLSKK